MRPSLILASFLATGCHSPPAPTAPPAERLGPPAASSAPSTRAADRWLDELPGGAAVYASVQLPALDALIEILPEDWVLVAVPAPLLRMGVDPRDGLADPLGVRFGIDTTRPILGAWGVVDWDRAQAAMRTHRAAIGSSTGEPGREKAASSSTEPPVAIYGRVVLPTRRGAAPDEALELVSSLHDGLRPWKACGLGDGCGAYERLGATGVLEADGATLIAFTEATSVVIDVVHHPFGDASEPSTTAALLALRAASKPPRSDEPDGCHAPDEGEALVLCIEPERSAAMGTVHGWGAMVSALQGIPSGQALALLDQGMAEASRPAELARPEPRFLEAGRFALARRGISVELTARWPTTEHGQRAFESALPGPMHAADPASVDEQILTPLATSLGDPGDGFRDPRALERRMLEGGWPTWLVVGARSWPNALGVLHGERVAPLFGDLESTGADASTTLTLTSGRLDLSVVVRPRAGKPSTGE